MSDRDIEIKVLQAEYEKACIAERANRFKKKVIKHRLKELTAENEAAEVKKRILANDLNYLLLEAFGGIV